jgi:hypothetical protein
MLRHAWIHGPHLCEVSPGASMSFVFYDFRPKKLEILKKKKEEEKNVKTVKEAKNLCYEIESNRTRSTCMREIILRF